MGMFDYLICQYPLPDSYNPNGLRFQTKSLHKNLDTYVINNSGILFKQSKLTLNGKETDIHENCHFHGDLTFYRTNLTVVINNLGIYQTDDNLPCEWREYSTKFKNGILIEIKRNNATMIDGYLKNLTHVKNDS